MKLSKIKILVLFYLSVGQANFIEINAQDLSDKHWILSNYIHFEFDSNYLEKEIIAHPMQGLVTSSFNSAISSKSGELQFHSSGCFIMDKKCNIIENGDSLSPGLLEIGYCKVGDAIWYQNVIILPFPGSDSLYYLFTLDVGIPFPFFDTTFNSLMPLHLYYHIVDMSAKNGDGEVIVKNTVAVTDTLAGGYIQACRHANGRDWWVIIPEWNSNCYHILYVSPNGVTLQEKTCTGSRHGDLDFGASVSFSPDGFWYARSFSWLNDTIGQVDLYAFDRCTGLLMHSSNLKFSVDLPYYTGLSFSPNSKLLYVSTYKSLWQFDISKPDIQKTRLLAGSIKNDFTMEKGSLYFQKLAPDGKIYIASPFGHKYLSTIYYPDKLGMDCEFKEHDLKLPLNRQNYAGLPNSPNYRLGPVDNSLCDSIGINNNPIANFRYESEGLSPYDISFINLSYFEPVTFAWDFGDGYISELIDPVHTFLENGIYNVCLIASNEYGSNSYCQEIPIMSTSISNTSTTNSISIFPNPVKDIMIINFEENNGYNWHIIIYNSIGEEVREINVTENNLNIDISMFPSGIYFLKFISNIENEFLIKSIVVPE